MNQFPDFRKWPEKFAKFGDWITLSRDTMTGGNNETLPGQQQPTRAENPAVTSEAEINPKDRKREAHWPAVLFYIHLNILGLYGIIILFTQTSFTTVIFTSILTLIGIIGVTCGSHRLWTHGTYTASTSLRVFLMLAQTLAGQGTIYNWVRLHRLHHLTFKTPDDPYYSDKDFISAQVFAQFRSLSPRQEKLLEKIDMKDIEEDKIVMFQKKFYWLLYIIVFVLLPINAPLEYWGDTVQAAIFVAFSFRYIVVANMAWLVNSAHFIWGLDKNFKHSESNMIFLVTKSYWPQYHYLLSWDYQSGEFGTYGSGCSTAIIRIFAALGVATDLKTITSEAVRQGLTNCVDTGRPLLECLTEAGFEEQQKLPKDHYLNAEKYK